MPCSCQIGSLPTPQCSKNPRLSEFCNRLYYFEFDRGIFTTCNFVSDVVHVVVHSAEPANGDYNFSFRLFRTATTASFAYGPITNVAVAVTEGRFTTSLDFGTNVFDGTAYWMRIDVRTNTTNLAASFVTLTPRQKMTATPYAFYAPQAGFADSAGNAGTADSATSAGFASIAAQATNATTASAVSPQCHHRRRHRECDDHGQQARDEHRGVEQAGHGHLLQRWQRRHRHQHAGPFSGRGWRGAVARHARRDWSRGAG